MMDDDISNVRCDSFDGRWFSCSPFSSIDYVKCIQCFEVTCGQKEHVLSFRLLVKGHELLFTVCKHS